MTPDVVIVEMGPFIEIVSYFAAWRLPIGCWERSGPVLLHLTETFQSSSIMMWLAGVKRSRSRGGGGCDVGLRRRPPPVVDGGRRRRRARRSSVSAPSSRLSCTRSRCSASRSEVRTGWSWICSCGRGTAAAAAPRSPSERNTGWSRPAGGAPLGFSSSSQTPLSLWPKWFLIDWSTRLE